MWAAVIDVTNLEDSGPGSLRASIEQANTQPGSVVRYVGPPGTIWLASALPPLTSSVQLLGPGPDQLALSGSNRFRVLEFGLGTTSLLSGMTIADGSVTNGGNGAGILSRGSLVVSNCVVRSNSVVNGHGGGIHSSGELRLVLTSIASNRVSAVSAWDDKVPGRSTYGGGISLQGGSLLIEDSTVAANQSMAASGATFQPGGEGIGGGIFIDGSLAEIRRTRLEHNRAIGGDGGGGVYGWGFGSPGSPGKGGGIGCRASTVTMVSCVISGNRAMGGKGAGGVEGAQRGGEGIGGGFFASESRVEISECTFARNRAIGGNGGGVTRGQGGAGGTARGAGLAFVSGTCGIVNSTVSANVAVGADGEDGFSNFARPVYGSPGPGGLALGGGVYSRGTGTLQMLNATVVLNRAEQGFAGYNDNRRFEGWDGTSVGGGLSTEARIRLQNCLIAQNKAATDPDLAGSFQSLGGNLIQRNPPALQTNLNTRDIVDIDPLIGGLQDNGGGIPTHALMAASPAIDRGVAEMAPTKDQRGVNRPQGNGPDIGAFERQVSEESGPLTMTIIPPDNAVLVGSDLTLTLRTGGAPPQGLQWYRNGVEIAGATTSTLQLLNVQSHDGGSYRVQSLDGSTLVRSEERIVEIVSSFARPSFSFSQAISSDLYNSDLGGVATDGSGNALLAASFRTFWTMGDLALTNSDGGKAVVIKVNRAGKMVWTSPGVSGIQPRGKAIGCDAAGNTYLVGDTGPSPDIFLQKLNPAGLQVWLHLAGGQGSDYATCLSVAPSGMLTVGGSFATNLVFGGTNLADTGGGDGFVVRCQSDGVVSWARQAGGGGASSVYDVAEDGAGNIYASGQFSGTIDFGGTNSLIAEKPWMPFLVVLDGQGKVRRLNKLLVAEEWAYVSALASDIQGNLLLAASYKGAAQFGTRLLAARGEANLLARFDPAGELVWLETDEKIPGLRVVAMVMDKRGDSLVAGSFSGPYGGNPDDAVLGNHLSSHGGVEGFVAKLASDGTWKWGVSAGGQGGEVASIVAADPLGGIYVCGNLMGHAWFGDLAIHGFVPDWGWFFSRVEVPPWLRSLPRESGAGDPGEPFTFLLEGEAGEVCRIERSEDFNAWSLHEIVTNAVGRLEIRDPVAPRPDHRFYRARHEP